MTVGKVVMTRRWARAGVVITAVAALVASVSGGSVASPASSPPRPVSKSLLKPKAGDLDGAAIDSQRGLMYLSTDGETDSVIGTSRVLLYTSAGTLLGRSKALTYGRHSEPLQLGAIAVDRASGLAYMITGASGGFDGGHPNRVLVLNRTKVVKQIRIGFHLYPSSVIAVNRHSGVVYVTDGKNLAIIHHQHVVRTVVLPQPNSTILTDDSNGFAYALDSPQSDFSRKGTVTVLRGTSVVKTIAVHQDYPTSGAVDPRTHDVFVADSNTPTVTVLHRARVLTSDLTLPLAKNDYPVAVAVNPRTGVAAAVAGGSVVFLDSTHVRASAELKDGAGESIAADPRNNLFLVNAEHAPRGDSGRDYGLIYVYHGARHVETLRHNVPPELDFSVDTKRDIVAGVDYFGTVLLLKAPRRAGTKGRQTFTVRGSSTYRSATARSVHHVVR